MFSASFLVNSNNVVDFVCNLVERDCAMLTEFLINFEFSKYINKVQYFFTVINYLKKSETSGVNKRANSSIFPAVLCSKHID